MQIINLTGSCTTRWAYGLPRDFRDVTKAALEKLVKDHQKKRGNLILACADKGQVNAMVELGFKKIAKYPSDAKDRHGNWIYIMAIGHEKLQPKSTAKPLR